MDTSRTAQFQSAAIALGNPQSPWQTFQGYLETRSTMGYLTTVKCPDTHMTQAHFSIHTSGGCYERELPNAESGWASGFSENCGAVAPSYTLSTGVNSGNPCPSFNQDINGRVDISVMGGSADGALPLADRQRQFVQNIPTTVTSLTGREETIHLMRIGAIPMTLVFEYP